MKTEIFTATSGGVIQGARATKMPHHSDGYVYYIVDYDEYDTDGADGPYPGTVEDFERECLDGRTWAEIEAITVEVY